MTIDKTWWKGEPPRRPTLSDKLADWNAFALIGGQSFIKGRRVLDIGPEYGLDAMWFAPDAEAWVCYEIAPDVRAHLEMLRSVTEAKFGIETGDALSLPYDEGSFDLVLDFGTFDNTGDPEASYREACRVLCRHGILISAYANAAVLGPVSADGDEIRSHPRALANFLTAQGMWVRGRYREDQARAIVIGQKYGEPRKQCMWNTTNICTCEGA